MWQSKLDFNPPTAIETCSAASSTDVLSDDCYTVYSLWPKFNKEVCICLFLSLSLCVCVCSSSKVFQKFAVSKQTPSHCQCWFRRAYEKRTSGWITKLALPIMQHSCVCMLIFVADIMMIIGSAKLLPQLLLLLLWPWHTEEPTTLAWFSWCTPGKWLCNDCLHHQYHRHHDCQLHTCKPGSAAESSTRCTFLISLKQRPFFAQTHLSAFATAALPARTGNTTTGNCHPRRRWANINLLGMSTLQAGRQAKCQAAH